MESTPTCVADPDLHYFLKLDPDTHLSDRIRNTAAQTLLNAENYIYIRAVDMRLPLQEGVVSLAARDQTVLPIHKLEQVRPTCKKRVVHTQHSAGTGMH